MQLFDFQPGEDDPAAVSSTPNLSVSMIFSAADSFLERAVLAQNG